MLNTRQWIHFVHCTNRWGAFILISTPFIPISLRLNMMTGLVKKWTATSQPASLRVWISLDLEEIFSHVVFTLVPILHHLIDVLFYQTYRVFSTATMLSTPKISQLQQLSTDFFSRSTPSGIFLPSLRYSNRQVGVHHSVTLRWIDLCKTGNSAPVVRCPAYSTNNSSCHHWQNVT